MSVFASSKPSWNPWLGSLLWPLQALVPLCVPVLGGVFGQVLVKLLPCGLQNQLAAQFSLGTRVLDEITKLCLKARAQKKIILGVFASLARLVWEEWKFKVLGWEYQGWLFSWLCEMWHSSLWPTLGSPGWAVGVPGIPALSPWPQSSFSLDTV